MNYRNYVNRGFEILPGFLLWLIIFSPVWAGLLFPNIVANIFVILSVYWVYRSLMLTFGASIGYFRYKKALKKDWLKECKKLSPNKLPDPSTLPSDSLLPYHLIVIPHYGETYYVLRRTIKAILSQNYPLKKIVISVSLEERRAKNDPEYADRIEKLKKEFGKAMGERLMCFIHPENLPGEKPGAASNRTWGTKKAVEVLEQKGHNINEFLVTAPDGDIVFHENYLAACSYTWITSEKRNNKFYQTAMYTFNNNYWKVPILVRILAISITLPVLSSSVMEKHKRETWSCFTLNLSIMKAVNYWDTSISVGADDTTFYWRPYFYLNGDWECEIFYIPLSADAVYHENYITNHKEQYKQYLRWGWGVITVPLALGQFVAKKNIPLFEKFIKIYRLFEVFVFWKAIVFIITFGIPIVLLLNLEFSTRVVSVTIPQTVSTLLTLSAFLLIPNALLKIKIVPEKPKEISWFRYTVVNILEIPLIIVSLFTLGYIPFVDATTRMMFGSKDKKVSWSQKKIS